MEWLNYHHLMYFWTVAREGSVSAACRRLHLSQPTISAQIRSLERSLGHSLFERSGRSLVLTEMGRRVFSYADEIFGVGRDLLDFVRGRPSGASARFLVGVADVLPKLMVHRLLAPALALPDGVRIVCHEAKPAELLARLSLHELDVVLSDTPVPPHVSVRAFSHRLGESGTVFFGTPELAARFRADFPRSFEGAPLLLPTPGSVARRQFDHWIESVGVRPKIVGEFEDSALLKVFGQSGAGLFAAPTVIEKEVRAQYGVKVVGRVAEIRESYYAITMQRHIKHPAVVDLTERARERLLARPQAQRRIAPKLR